MSTTPKVIKKIDIRDKTDIKSESAGEKIARLKNRFRQQQGSEKINIEMVLELFDEFNHRLTTLEKHKQSL